MKFLILFLLPCLLVESISFSSMESDIQEIRSLLNRQLDIPKMHTGFQSRIQSYLDQLERIKEKKMPSH